MEDEGACFGPYNGDTVTDATRLDIDHMIPLKNAHNSGGGAWDKSRKAAFANDMSYADHLIAVTASANRKKGAQEDLRNGSPPTEDAVVITLSIGCG